MNSEWAEHSVGDLFELINGYAFKSSDFKNCGIPVIKIKNVKAGAFIDDNFDFVDPDFLISRSDKQPKQGDLLITMSGNRHDGSRETWVGKVSWFNQGKNYLVNQRVGILRLRDSGGFNARFLAYQLSSDAFQDHFIAVATSSGGQANLSPNQIKEMILRIPGKKIQDQIATILGEIEDKIDLNRRINQTLEAMAQAIFKSWFVDFDPVKAKIAAIEQGEDPLRAAMRAISGKTDAELDQMPREHHNQLATTAALFPDEMQDSELGETNSQGTNLDAVTGGPQGGGMESRHIPKRWQVVPLSKMIRLIGGGTPKRSEPSYWGGTIPWFSVKDVPNDGDVWVVDTDEKITAAGLQKSSTKLLRKGTTIISARGTVGKLALVGQEMAMNQSCYGVVGTDGVGDFFNYFNLKFAVEILKRNTHGAVFDTITQATFETVTCVKPGNSVMKQFDEIVEPLLKGIRSNVFQSRELAELRDTLLPKLLSGELSVDLVAEENVQ